MLHRLTLALVLISLPSFAQELGLDLSAESQVKTVVLIPPVYKVTTTEGSFAGFNAAKTTEKLDIASHKKLLAALEAQLGKGKVVATDATNVALGKEKLTVAALRTPQGMAQLAKATNAAWVIFYDINKGVLTASIYTLLGETTGKTGSVSNVTVGSLTPAQADDLQKQLSRHLVELSKPKPEELAKAQPVVVAPPPPEEDVSGEVENEIARERAARRGIIETIDLDHPRVIIAVGGGAFWRDQLIGGSEREQLAQLRGATAPGISAFVQVNPLHFLAAFREDKPYSDLFLDFNYRRDFVKLSGSGGSFEGKTCSVVDDELQARLNFRWKLPGVLPSIGVGGGWAQERAAVVGCDLPVVSAVYRGVDAQLRVRQALFSGRLAIDLAFGPRILMTGPLAPKAGLSWAGEGWLEAKPASLLYLRGGARFFRAVMSDDVGVVTADVRAFFAFEAGVHL